MNGSNHEWDLGGLHFTSDGHTRGSFLGDGYSRCLFFGYFYSFSTVILVMAVICVCSSLIFSGYNFVLLRMQLRTISLQRPLPNLNQDTGHLQGTVQVSVSAISLLLYFWYSLYSLMAPPTPFFFVPHKFASNLWYLCPDDVVICGVLLWGTFSSWPDTVPSL